MLANYEIQDSVVGEEGVAHVATPCLALGSVRMTLGEGAKADECLLKHRVPGLSVADSDFAPFLKSSQTRDVLLDIVVQPRSMEYDEASQS
jgi:hypothetical protein